MFFYVVSRTYAEIVGLMVFSGLKGLMLVQRRGRWTKLKSASAPINSIMCMIQENRGR